MKIRTISHLAFYTTNYDEMLHFYCDCLGMKRKFTLLLDDLYKISSKRLESAGLDGPELEKRREGLAKLETLRTAPWLTYIEIAPRQFLELFNAYAPMSEGNLRAGESRTGYNHMSLEVDDIHSAHGELSQKGISIRTDITMGPDHTYQFWIDDPDGNQIEIFQYTEQSLQIVGNNMR